MARTRAGRAAARARWQGCSTSTRVAAASASPSGSAVPDVLPPLPRKGGSGGAARRLPSPRQAPLAPGFTHDFTCSPAGELVW